MSKSRIIFIICLFTTFFSQVSAQDSYTVKVESGFLGFDLFKNVVRSPVQSYTLQSSFEVDKSFRINRKWSPVVGIGYSNIFVFDEGPLDYIGPDSEIPSEPNLLHFGKLSYGLDYTITQRLFTGVRISHYIYLGKLYDIGQPRSFANLDLQLGWRISTKSELLISSPFTLTPIYVGAYQGLLDQPLERPYPTVNGLLIGFRFRI